MSSPYSPNPLPEAVRTIIGVVCILLVILIVSVLVGCIDRAEPCNEGTIAVDGECLAECDYPRPIHGHPECAAEGVRCELHGTDEGQTAWVCVPEIGTSEPHKDAEPRPAP